MKINYTVIRHHDTRQKENFHTYVVKSEIGKRAIKFKGLNLNLKLWNSLPTVIKKQLNHPLLFKHKLKTHLLQSLD